MESLTMPTQFLVKRDAILDGKFMTTADMLQPGDNQVLIESRQFAFTANNVTYAVLGERLGYWRFFPANEDGWGIIPVWGFGSVIESNHPGIRQGERVYGFFPMATHLIVTADKVNAYGFTDAAPHRQELPAIHNNYVRADANESFEESLEAVNSLLRPMFTTSFLLDDFFFDNDMFGASTLVLSSASSKTAYGTAFLLDANRQNRPDYKIVGLTSPSNVAFAERLGFYDEVLAYDDAAKLDASQRVAYLDFSGSQAVRRTLYEHFQDNLLHDAAVGITHWDQTGSEAQGQFFFAPSQLEKRLKEWGGRTYRERLTSAWLDFINQAQNWMAVTNLTGEADMMTLYQDMLAGKAKPEKGYMLSFSD
jgi:hypothetical protein